MKKSKRVKNNCKDSRNLNRKLANEKNDYIKEKSSSSDTSSSSTESKVNYEELIAQINQLNLSFDTLLIILTAILLNIYYVYYTRTQALDTLNNTKYADLLIDGTKLPRITNAMFLYATAIFLEINYSNYENLNSVQGEERNCKEINKAYRTFFSTLLVLIATAMSRSNLEV